MTDKKYSQWDRHPDRPIEIEILDCPDDLTVFADAEEQARRRALYAAPGIIVVDNVVTGAVLEELQASLTGEVRTFKSAFNKDIPQTEAFREARLTATRRITELTNMLFGYDLEAKDSLGSFRNMVTKDEPLHFDTYAVPCGERAMMAVLNFDVKPRCWRVGPSFYEACAEDPKGVEKILENLPPGEPASFRMRTVADRQGIGPLRDGIPLHAVEFAPGAVWFANPKTIAHQITYGGGALFEQWNVDAGEKCGCQPCVLEELGIHAPNARKLKKEKAA